jgi:hypothetical protein
VSSGLKLLRRPVIGRQHSVQEEHDEGLHSVNRAGPPSESPGGVYGLVALFDANPLRAHFVISPVISNAAGGAPSAMGILMAAPVHSPSPKLDIVA